MLKKIKPKLFAERTTEYYSNTGHSRHERPPPKRKKGVFKNLLKHRLSRFKGRRVSAVRKSYNSENHKHVYPNKQILTNALKEETRDEASFVKLHQRVTLYKSMDFKMFITSVFVFNVIRDMVSRIFILICARVWAARVSPLKIKEKLKILSFENTKSKYKHIFDFNYKICQQYLVYTVHVHYQSQEVTTPTRKTTSRPPQTVSDFVINLNSRHDQIRLKNEIIDASSNSKNISHQISKHTQMWTHNEMKGTYLRPPHDSKSQIKIRKVPSNKQYDRKSEASQLYKNKTIFEQAGDFRNINQTSDEASTSRLDEKRENQICWLSSTTLTTESSSSRMNFCRKTSENQLKQKLENSKKRYDSTPISNNKSKTFLAARNLIARLTKHRKHTTPECAHLSMQMDRDPENTTKGKVVGMQWRCSNNASKNTKLLKQKIEAISEEVDYIHDNTKAGKEKPLNPDLSRPKSLNPIKEFLQNKRKQLKKNSPRKIIFSVESEPNTQPIIDSLHKITHIQKSPTTILQTPNPVDRCKLADFGPQDYHHTRPIDSRINMKLRPNKVNLGTFKNISEQRNGKQSTLTMQGFYLNIPPATSKRTINTINNQSINNLGKIQHEETEAVAKTLSKQINLTVCNIREEFPPINNEKPNWRDTSIIDKHPSEKSYPSLLPNYSNSQTVAFSNTWSAKFPSTDANSESYEIISRSTISDLSKPANKHTETIDDRFKKIEQSLGLLDINPNTLTEPVLNIVTDSNGSRRMVLDIELGTSSNKLAERFLGKPNLEHPSTISKAQVVRAGCKTHKNIYLEEVKSAGLLSIGSNKSSNLLNDNNQTETEVLWTGIKNDSKKFERLPLTESDTSKGLTQKPLHYLHQSFLQPLLSEHQLQLEVSSKDLVSQSNPKQYLLQDPPPLLKTIVSADAVKKLSDKIWWKQKRLRKSKAISMKKDKPGKWDNVLEKAVSDLKNKRDTFYEIVIPISEVKSAWDSLDDELKLKIIESKEEEKLMLIQELKKIRERSMSKCEEIFDDDDDDDEEKWSRSVKELEMKIYEKLTEKQSGTSNEKRKLKRFKTKTNKVTMMIKKENSCEELQWRTDEYSNAKSSRSSCSAINTPRRGRRKRLSRFKRFSKFNTTQKSNTTITSLQANFSTEPQCSAGISEISLCTYSDMLIESETGKSTAGSVMVSPSINVKSINKNDAVSVYHCSDNLSECLCNNASTQTRIGRTTLFSGFRTFKRGYTSHSKFRKGVYFRPKARQIRKKELVSNWQSTIKNKDTQLSRSATFNSKSSVSLNNSRAFERLSEPRKSSKPSAASSLHRLANNTASEGIDSVKQKKQSSLNYKSVKEEAEVTTKAKGIQTPRASNQSFQDQISKRSFISSKNSRTSERISALEDMGSIKQKKQASLNYKSLERETEVAAKAMNTQSPETVTKTLIVKNATGILKRRSVNSNNSRTSKAIVGQRKSRWSFSFSDSNRLTATTGFRGQQNEKSSRSIKSMENETVTLTQALEPTESSILEQHKVDIPRSNTIENTEDRCKHHCPTTDYETQAQLCNKYQIYGVSLEDLESLFKKYIKPQSLPTKNESNVDILKELVEPKKTATEMHGSTQPEESIVSDNIQEKSNKSSESIQNIPPSKPESLDEVESIPLSSESLLISYNSLQSISNKLSQEHIQTRKPSKSPEKSYDSVQSKMSTKYPQNIDSIQARKPSKSLRKKSVSDQSILSTTSSEEDVEPIQTSSDLVQSILSSNLLENNTDYVQTKKPPSKSPDSVQGILTTKQTIKSSNCPAINFCTIQNQLSSKYPQMDIDSVQIRKFPAKSSDSVQNIQSSNSQQKCVQTKKSIKSSAKSSCSTQAQTFLQDVDSIQIIKPSKSPAKSSDSVQSILSKKSPRKHIDSIQTGKLSKYPVKSSDLVQSTVLKQPPEKDIDSIQTKKLSKSPAKNSDSVQSILLSSILLSGNSPQKVVQAKKWNKSPPKNVASILRMLSKKIPKEDTDSVQTRKPRKCPEECSGLVETKKSSKPLAERSDLIQNTLSSKSPQNDISVSPENSSRSIQSKSPQNDIDSVQTTKQSKPLTKSSDSVQNILTSKYPQKGTESDKTKKPNKSPQKGDKIRKSSKPPAEISDSNKVPRKSPERGIHTGKSRKSKETTSPCSPGCKVILEIEGNKVLLGNDCFRKAVQIQDTASINIEIKGKDEKLNFSTPDVKYSYSANTKN